MTMSLKIAIYLMTATVSLLSRTVTEVVHFNNKCVGAPVWQTAHLGGSVTINCTYPREEEGPIKYFCRQNEDVQCKTLIEAHTSGYTKLSRFSLKDHEEQGVYTVTMSMLTRDDAGRYRCALQTVKDNAMKYLTEIHLHIFNRDDKTQTIKPNDRKTAKMMCHYPESHVNNTKHLCKGENPFNCSELIHTEEGEIDATEGRLYIRDSKRSKYFYVNINNLRTSDSGTYWCSFGRGRCNDGYTRTDLFVADRTKIRGPPTQPTAASPSPTSPPATLHVGHSNSGMLGVTVVCLALLVIVVVVLYRHKLPRIQACCASGGWSEQSTDAGQNTEENHRNHKYEEVQGRNQEASSGGALSSVYALINCPADQLHYASVNFLKDSVTVSTDGNARADTGTNVSSLCVYSSVGGTPEGTRPPTLSSVSRPGEP